MVFYEYTYHFKQDLSKVYEYFLQKAYLIRFFKDSSDEVVLNSDEDNPYLEEGEKMELVIGDRESISSYEIETLEIQEEVLIDLSIKFTDIVDKSDSSLEDDAETFIFMKKHLGIDIFFRLEFYDDFDRTRVRETAELQNHTLAWYAKAFWKLMGWYYIFKQRNIHQEVKDEIEFT
ncbi:MAG: hypothetical protein R8P61_07375 [Bacteroidia bacterium]|nr:hypothetical protein [Bacteroidia bacterium]